MFGAACDALLNCVHQGRFTIAAKHHITIAEVYESELVDIEKVSLKHLAAYVSSRSLTLIHFGLVG